MTATKTKLRRRADVEAEIGMPIAEYLQQAVANKKSYAEMRRELRVTETTLWRWAKREGYETVYPIRKKR